MIRISSAFSAPSALAAALLLAACAPESLTSSDSPSILARGDSAALADSSAGKTARDVAAIAGTGTVADPAKTGSVPDTTASETLADTASGTPADSVPGTAADSVTGSMSDSESGTKTDTASGTLPDTPTVADAVPSGSGIDSGTVPAGSGDVPAVTDAARALEGTWKRVGHSIEPAISVDGVPVTDLLAQDAVESRDNLTAFKAGGVWTEDEGAMKSSPAGPQSEDGAWSLDPGGRTLTLRSAEGTEAGGGFQFEVLELSATTLKVAASSGGYSDGLRHSETITFVRQ